MAEFAACDTGGQAVVADRNLLVHVFVREVIRALRHGPNKDTDALLII